MPENNDSLSNKFEQARSRILGGSKKILTEEKKITDEIKQQNKDYEARLSILDKIGSVGRRAFLGISAAILTTTRVSSPAQFQQFTLAMRDLACVVGQILTPVLQDVTRVLRSVADFILNLSDSTKGTIGSIAALALGLSFLTPIVVKVVQVGFMLANVLKVVWAATGPVGIVIAILATALGAAAASGSDVGGVFGALKNVVGALGRVLKSILLVLEPIQRLFVAIGNLVGTVLAPALNIVAGVLSLIADGFEALADSAIVEALNWVISRIEDMVSLLQQAWELLEEVGSALTFGLFDSDEEEAPKRKKSSVGAGGRDVRFQSGESFQKDLISNAIKAGFGARTQEEMIVQNTTEMVRLLEQLVRVGVKGVTGKDLPGNDSAAKFLQSLFASRPTSAIRTSGS